MATEREEAIYVIKTEGVSAAAADFAKVGAAAEAMSSRVANASKKAEQMLLPIFESGGEISSLFKRWDKKAKIGGLSAGKWNLGSKSYGFSALFDNLGLKNEIKDRVGALQGLRSAFLKNQDSTIRNSLRQSFLAQRSIMSSGLANLMCTLSRQPLMLGYTPSVQGWNQSDIDELYRQKDDKARKEREDRFAAVRNKYSWLFTSGYDPDRRNEIQRQLFGRNKTQPHSDFEGGAGGSGRGNGGGGSGSEGGGGTIIPPMPPPTFSEKVDALTGRITNSNLFKGLNSVTSLLGKIHRIVGWIAKILSIGREHFFMSKQSSMAGLLDEMGTRRGLVPYMNQEIALGGVAASASALHAKIAANRANLVYGGGGGAYMEAARLFGVSHLGSNKYGLATNSEWLRNIASRMETLDEEGKIALANTVGLSPEQFYAMRKGTSGYEAHRERNRTYNEKFSEFWADNGVVAKMFRSVLGDAFGPYLQGMQSRLMEGREGQYHQDASEEWVESWGRLKIAFDEFCGIIGDALLPILSSLALALSFLLKAVNMILAPLTKLLGAPFRLINKVFGDVGKDIVSQPPSNMSAEQYYDVENQQPNISINIGTVNDNDLGIAPGASNEDKRKAYADFFGDVAERIGTNARRA